MTTKSKTSSNIFISELIGTFFLVLIGCGAAVLAGEHIGYLGIAFAFGLTLAVMTYCLSGTSVCHINPAVTIGMFFAKKIDAKEVLTYILAQATGAVAAGAVLYLIASGTDTFNIAQGFASNGFGEHSPGGYNFTSAALTEIILTGMLVFAVLSTTHPKFPEKMTGVTVGLALFLAILVGLQVTNASINPARSLGTAVFAGGWAIEQLWFFVVMPIAGAFIATIVHKMLPQK